MNFYKTDIHTYILKSIIRSRALDPSFKEKLDKYLPLTDKFVDVQRFNKIWTVTSERKVKAVAESDDLLYTEIEKSLKIRSVDKNS